MIKRPLICLIVLIMAFTSNSVWSVVPIVKIEVLYMNHGPLQDTLSKLKNLFSEFKGNVNVTWYDFESNEGEAFKAKKGISQHVPLVIWINGSTKIKLGQQEFVFWGFPTGAGPAFFQGKWSVEILKQAIEQTIGKK